MQRVRMFVPALALTALTAIAVLVADRAGAQPIQNKSTAPPASLPAPAKAAAIVDTLEQRILACAQCHGKQGEGVRKNEYYPRLAGKPVEYLYNQLIGFREKTRSASPIMTYMVGGLSDNFLHEIAGHYATLRSEFPPPAPAPTGARRVVG